jgi:hypothetical protein
MKNQASYERRAQQRQQDLAHLARLEAPSSWVRRTGTLINCLGSGS